MSQISTGKKENKFGVNGKTFFELVNYCKNSNDLELKCLSVHIGSQILDHKPYEKMLKVINKIIPNSLILPNKSPIKNSEVKVKYNPGLTVKNVFAIRFLST